MFQSLIFYQRVDKKKCIKSLRLALNVNHGYKRKYRG